MLRSKPPYRPQLRQQMVELVAAGRSPAQLAREFDCSEQSIHTWVSRARADEGQRRRSRSAGRSGEALSTPEREALARLRRDNRQLKLEPDIPAKATAWFVPARTSGRPARVRTREGEPGRRPLEAAGAQDVPRAGRVGQRVRRPARREPMTAELVLAALDMALKRRRAKDVIHHSDQGSQYTSLALGKRCQEMGVQPSMGSVGDGYDNAMADSFFASLECELIDRRSWPSKAEARMALFTYIEGWYNPRAGAAARWGNARRWSSSKQRQGTCTPRPPRRRRVTQRVLRIGGQAAVQAIETPVGLSTGKPAG